MRVTSENIAVLTASPDFAQDVPSAPSVQELIEILRACISTVGLHRRQDQAEKDMSILRRAVMNPPSGMTLAPFYRRPIDKSQQKKIDAEYNRTVLGRAFAYYASTAPDIWCSLGVTAQGIEEMKEGHRPRNSMGYVLPVSLEHIVTRSVSGNWGYTKLQDPNLPAQTNPKFLVNHIDNITPVFNKDHEIINSFDELYRNARTGWGLKLVPREGIPYLSRP